MTMTLSESKRLIRAWIKQFSDEKLAQVYAFNQDGKMQYSDACGCLLGVTLSDVLHIDLHNEHPNLHHHYHLAKALPGAAKAEAAYHLLGWDLGRMVPLNQARASRQRRLSAILRAEMRLRDRKRSMGGTGDRGSKPLTEITACPVA